MFNVDVNSRVHLRPDGSIPGVARRRRRPAPTMPILAGLVALVLAACGGAQASPGGGSPDAGGASQVPATEGSGVSAAPGSSNPAGPPSSASASAGAANGDLCGLLSDVEIEDATGVAVKTKEPPAGDAALINPGCRWALADDISALTLRVWPTGGLERFNFVYEAAEELPGLGDAARFRAETSAATSLRSRATRWSSSATRYP